LTLSVEVERRLGAFRIAARFEAGPGITVLFGRSGAGKTSLVNMIAGLLRPDAGRIAVDGTVLFDSAAKIDLPAHRRGVGYVFQDSRLFPHLSVRQNLLYSRWFTGLRSGAGRTGRAEFDAVIDMLGLGRLLARRPGALSGGERQRAALGRALLSRPRLLLMDEPLAALDAARREEILPYIERLRDEAAVPIVYVSHGLNEVARLATTMVLLADGGVIATGPVADVLARSDLPQLSTRDDAGAVLDATVAAHDDVFSLTLLDTAAGPLRVPRVGRPVGAALRLRIRARDVMVSLGPPEGLSALNLLPATIREIGAPHGAAVELRLVCGTAPLLARVTRQSVERLGLEPGRPVWAVIKSVALASETAGDPATGFGPELDA